MVITIGGAGLVSVDRSARRVDHRLEMSANASISSSDIAPMSATTIRRGAGRGDWCGLLMQ
jgi:hypothetical protein